MAKCLSILATLTISSCCSAVDTKIGTPARPDLIPITQEQWERTPEDVQDIVSTNDLALKQHIRILESRIAIHDEHL